MYLCLLLLLLLKGGQCRQRTNNFFPAAAGCRTRRHPHNSSRMRCLAPGRVSSKRNCA